jgi:GT2 family glycosyltransferase
MDVSIIIVNYNTFELTCQCIQSVIDKTEGISYEVIVVDNASHEIAPQKFLDRFPDITLITSAVNVGFAKGNNLGVAKATGDYILLLNSDTILKNNAVAIGVEVLQHNPNTAVMAARLEYADGKLQHNCQRFPSVKYKAFELLRLQKFLPANWGGKILMGFFFDHNQHASPDWVWGTFFMFRRDLLPKLPKAKLDDQFFMYVEDVQWCMDFRRLGYSIAFDPRAQVIHLMGKSGGAKSALMDENMNRFMEVYYSPWERKLIKLLDRMLLKK